MFTRIFVLSVLSVLSLRASADAPEQCLRDASARQLVREVYYRMTGDRDPDEDERAIYDFACDGSYNLVVTAYNGRTGNTARYSAYSSRCPTDKALFVDRIVNKGLNTMKVIAWCDGSYKLVRLALRPEGRIDEISREYSPTCPSDADAINDRL